MPGGTRESVMSAPDHAPVDEARRHPHAPKRYGVQVLNACESFKHYADEKVHALEGEVNGEKLAGMLVGAALGPVGGLTEHIANAALKFVADKVVDLVKDKLTEGAKKAAGNGD